MFNVVNIEQNTPQWLDWRKSGIGGSDANAIMGVSPWTTPYEIWLDKTGQGKDFKGNFFTDHGHRTEPEARAKITRYISDYLGKEVQLNAVCVEDNIDGLPWKASLDGATTDFEVIAEIKCPVKKSKEFSGIVPEIYVPQVQHQAMGIKPKHAFYCEYYKKEDKLYILEYHPDLVYMELLKAEEKKFWEMVVKKEAPDTGITNLNSDETWVSLAAKFREYKLAYDKSAAALDAVKTELTKMAEAASIEKAIAGGVMAYKKTRKGNVKYASIPELKGVDLEPYRGASLSFYEFRLKGEK